MFPGLFSGVGAHDGDTPPCCCVALLPELCESGLCSAPTSLAAIKQIKYLGLQLPLGRLGLPGSTGLGLVASPEALRLPGGLEDVAAGCGDRLGSGYGGRGPPSVPVPAAQRRQEVARVTLTPPRCCVSVE